MDVPFSRREFLKAATGVAVVALGVPSRALSATPVRFGLCADVHQDVMHDAPERMAAFIRDMNEKKVDFVAQLGDFCVPKPENQHFLDTFHAFEGPHYHVLGNHDTDDDNLTKKGYTQDETRAFWGMKTNHYHFVEGGIRVFVLDGNDRNPEADPSEYPRHIGREQQAWLVAELDRTREPVVVFSHQSAEHHWGLDNGPEMRAILEATNRRAGYRRVVAWINGHSHIDDLSLIEGIPYVHINSMSYYWLGEAFRNFCYPPHIHAAAPMIEFTAPYRDPVWATVTIDPEAMEIRFEGRQGHWAGRSPEELGYGETPEALRGVSPSVADRDVKLDRKV